MWLVQLTAAAVFGEVVGAVHSWHAKQQHLLTSKFCCFLPLASQKLQVNYLQTVRRKHHVCAPPVLYQRRFVTLSTFTISTFMSVKSCNEQPDLPAIPYKLWIPYCVVHST